MDFGNFNTGTHVKGITNEASSRSQESLRVKGPSTPEEKLSMEEAQPCVCVHCFCCRGANTALGVPQLQNDHISEFLQIPVTGEGTAPTQEGKSSP